MLYHSPLRPTALSSVPPFQPVTRTATPLHVGGIEAGETVGPRYESQTLAVEGWALGTGNRTTMGVEAASGIGDSNTVGMEGRT